MIKFLHSKPPGRRMVTSDVQTFFIRAFQFANIALYTGITARILFGLLPYPLIFCFVELMKQSLHFGAAIANVSAILQISIIFNFEWVHKTEDKVSNLSVNTYSYFYYAIFRKFFSLLSLYHCCSALLLPV